MPEPVWTVLLAMATALQEPEPRRESPEGEIIVTGERVPRSLRETSSSVAVATSADLDRMAGPDRIEQFLEFVPNVQQGSGGEGPAIRGQDTTGPTRDLPAFLGGLRPRTSLIVDGRAVGFNEFISGVAPIWDVERIEVFRTPQTTTQGRNSIAGAIFIHTQDPSMNPEYRVRAIVGELDTFHYSAAVSSPIVKDQLAVRITGDYRYSRTASDIRDNVPGADADHDEYGQVRVKLLAAPKILPNARIELTYSHLQSKMLQSELIRAPFRKRQNLTGFAAIFRTNIDSLTTSVRYDLDPHLRMNAVITFGDSDMRRFALPGAGQTEIRTNDWSAETVLNWSPDGPLRAVGGISRTHQHLRQHINPIFLFGEGNFDDWQDGTGLFGEASLMLTQKTTVTAGLRYQRDSQRRVGRLGTGAIGTDLTYDRSFDTWLPKISVAYDFSPSIRAGVLVQRAYNPGGVNLRADIGELDVFDAEMLWDYEVFARATLAGGAIRLSGNAFYYDMRNAQRAQPYTVQNIGLADLFNAPRATSYGLDAEMQWRASSKFEASVGLGLLRTKLIRVPIGFSQFQGNEFQRAPHLSMSASVNWRPSDRLSLSAQLAHNTDYWSDDGNDPLRHVDGRTKADARAEWRTARFKLFGYARNIFDNFYMTWLFTPVSGTAGKPREIGVGVEANF